MAWRGEELTNGGGIHSSDDRDGEGINRVTVEEREEEDTPVPVTVTAEGYLQSVSRVVAA